MHRKTQHDMHEGFLGGPSNLSVLVSSTNHVVVRLWEGEVVEFMGI